MGQRKRLRAERMKEARAHRAYAILRNCPLSARKVRLVADMIRGVEVARAGAILHYTQRNSAPYLEKLLNSALANWAVKNEDADPSAETLYVTQIMVDEGRMLKRLRPRAQGRAGRILKRFCHVTLEVGTRQQAPAKNEVNAEQEVTEQ